MLFDPASWSFSQNEDLILPVPLRSIPSVIEENGQSGVPPFFVVAPAVPRSSRNLSADRT